MRGEGAFMAGASQCGFAVEVGITSRTLSETAGSSLLRTWSPVDAGTRVVRYDILSQISYSSTWQRCRGRLYF